MSRRWRTVALIALLVGLLVYPYVVPQPGFWVVGIGLRALWLGLVAMSVSFLAGYVGLVSLGQLTFWGIAGYAVGYLAVLQGYSFGVAVLAAVVIAVVAAFLVGLIAVRVQGIFFVMLTLAISQVLYFSTFQLTDITRGFTGIAPIRAPDVMGISLNAARPMYYTVLFLCILVFLGLRYLTRTPFGIALQGIRDNPERMKALGYPVYWYTLGAFTIAGAVAALSGIVAVFYHGQIVPDAVGLVRSIDVLVVAIIGGIGYLYGAFIGAVAFSILQMFAQLFTDRYNTLIGLVFVAILLFWPSGLVGLFQELRNRMARLFPGTAEPPRSQADVAEEAAPQHEIVQQRD